jgi:hypothetical protein
MIVTDYEQKDDGSKEEGVGKTGGKPRKLSGVKKKSFKHGPQPSVSETVTQISTV